MNSNTSETDERVLDMQREQWQSTFASRPEKFGVEPSYAARRTAALFQREGKRAILELGSGQGRDTLLNGVLPTYGGSSPICRENTPDGGEVSYQPPFGTLTP